MNADNWALMAWGTSYSPLCKATPRCELTLIRPASPMLLALFPSFFPYLLLVNVLFLVSVIFMLNTETVNRYLDPRAVHS